MRNFFINFGKDYNDILTEQEFRGFIATAVLQNRDIQFFKVTEIDSRLTPFQAAAIAAKFNLANEVIDSIEKGSTPCEALLDWVK